jgi:hypothetical protein
VGLEGLRVVADVDVFASATVVVVADAIVAIVVVDDVVVVASVFVVVAAATDALVALVVVAAGVTVVEHVRVPHPPLIANRSSLTTLELRVERYLPSKPLALALVTTELLKNPIWALELLKSWIYCI